ncbi:hypothetical protein [Rhodobacter ferrooxidans]|uniref:Twin-arginine translocation pathway signal n=1 Tax=Rhodobacter ferrooxidans TaxID=371731 RepID=C8RZ36_9RHOB|nr:hypothetical protein [Rhodobacter sp. SW2]EEW25993.1 hypothetical protein Rsw2DRAFT_1064 [Rhodobacter sp. SW2]
MTSRRSVLAGLAALAVARPGAAALPRPLLGTTRWPHDVTLKAMGQVQRFLAEECDMSAPMILGGVPWADAVSGNFSAVLQGELSWKAPAGHKVLLSLGALDTLRRGLAPLSACAKTSRCHPTGPTVPSTTRR